MRLAMTSSRVIRSRSLMTRPVQRRPLIVKGCQHSLDDRRFARLDLRRILIERAASIGMWSRDVGLSERCCADSACRRSLVPMKGSMMCAAWYDRTGPAAEVLSVGDLPIPEPGPGEVRLRVIASGLNPTDVKSRVRPGSMPAPRVIPHQDGAGVIDKVGAGVPASRVGERVWVYIVQWQRAWGTGAVGHYAVQLAKWAGARVIATVSSAEKAAAAAAGADHTVNYRTGEAAKEILALTGGAGVDRIVDVDFGGNLGVSIEAIKVNGVIATYASMGEREPRVPFYALMAKNVTIRPVLIYTMPERAQDEGAADVLRLCEAGRLLHQIGARFPLERIVQAHEAQESGKVTGNIVVEVGKE